MLIAEERIPAACVLYLMYSAFEPLFAIKCLTILNSKKKVKKHQIEGKYLEVYFDPVLLRIQEGKNYPENFHLLKCWMFFSEG
jgi:hypothetical protein